MGYMSQILEYESVNLGPAEQIHLHLIGTMNTCAYTAFLFMNRQRKTSYKNIHKTFMKLKNLGLIKKKGGVFLRNAIYYKLTSRGLFQILLTQEVNNTLLLEYRNDPILQLILYPYFEQHMIEYFNTVARESFISDYINYSCQRILHHVEEFRQFYGRRAKLNLSMLEQEIDGIVRKEIMAFVYTIVTLNNASRMRFTNEDKSGNYHDNFDFVINKDEEYYPYKDYTKVVVEARENDKNYCTLFPKDALMKDKKFMSLFGEMKREFERGCKLFS